MKNILFSFYNRLWLVLLIFSISTLPLHELRAGEDDKGVKFFKGSWAELSAEAKKTGKPFFVDFWAPWCGPCRMLNTTTFIDPNVVDYSAKNFLAYKLNVDQGEGRSLGGKYQISSIPAIVFFNSEGEEIGREVGYRNGEQFLAALQKYATKAGKPKPTKGSSSVSFEDYLKAKAEIVKPLEKTIIQDDLIDSLRKQAYNFGKNRNEYDFNNLKEDNTTKLGNNLWVIESYYYLGAKNYDKFISIVNPIFEQNKLTPTQIHWLCWQCVTLSDIPHEPMRWINQALRINPCYELMDTKAALLYKDGKKDDAVELIKQAEKAAKTESKDDAPTKILAQIVKNS